MTYEITPIDFQNHAPTNDDIVEYIERNSSQKVRIVKREFPGQFSIFFESYPNDILQFSRKENGITISGNSAAAPALSTILYSALVSLGGDQKSEIPLVQFPVSDKYIEKTNRKIRLSLNIFSTIVWTVLLVLASLLFFLLFA